MDWDQISNHERRPSSRSSYTPAECIRVALIVVGGGLLLFNAVGLSRIQSDLEARFASLEAATNARLTALEHHVSNMDAGMPIRPIAQPARSDSPPPPPLPPPHRIFAGLGVRAAASPLAACCRRRLRSCICFFRSQRGISSVSP